MSGTFTFRGKYPADLTREELIQALTEIVEGDYLLRRDFENQEISRLKNEIKIKDEFIDRLIILRGKETV